MVQLATTNQTTLIRRAARAIGLVTAVIVALIIGSTASDWLLKGILTICQPRLEGVARWTFCRMIVSAMGDWVDVIAAAPWPIEGTIRAGFLLIAILGIAMAWVREGLGGALLLVAAVMLGVFAYLTADHNQLWNILLISGPFVVLGALYLICWQRAEGRQT